MRPRDRINDLRCTNDHSPPLPTYINVQLLLGRRLRRRLVALCLGGKRGGSGALLLQLSQPLLKPYTHGLT